MGEQRGSKGERRVSERGAKVKRGGKRMGSEGATWGTWGNFPPSGNHARRWGRKAKSTFNDFPLEFLPLLSPSFIFDSFLISFRKF